MKSLQTAYILWLLSFVGLSGIHRFYLGKPVSGIVYLVTGGVFGIGTIIDAFVIPSMVQEARLREGIAGRVTLDELFQSGSGTQQAWQQAALKKEPLEQGILRVAKRGKGFAAPAEVALESGVSIEQAKNALDTLSERGFCELMVRQTGALVYYFPDFDDDPERRTAERLL